MTNVSRVQSRLVRIRIRYTVTPRVTDHENICLSRVKNGFAVLNRECVVARVLAVVCARDEFRPSYD
jgi:hypothetical protein